MCSKINFFLYKRFKDGRCASEILGPATVSLSHSNSPTLEHDFVTPFITKSIFDFLIN